MKNKWFVFATILGLSFNTAAADDCLLYKLNPVVGVSVPPWSKEVIQPLRPMDMWHGNVVATLVENYEIIGDTTSIEDGFCVSLKEVRASVGYSDFQVKIDSRHAPESCAYNAILTHEDEHIRAYLSVIDDLKTDIRDAVHAAADSVVPVFVRTSDEIDSAMDTLHKKFQGHPELVLMNQRIQAAQEIRNKSIDQGETGAHLRQCM
jgi:hypothetical protein